MKGFNPYSFHKAQNESSALVNKDNEVTLKIYKLIEIREVQDLLNAC